MNKVFCSVAEDKVDPLFEVFDGGDFILSSYHDIESSDTELQVYFPEESRIEDAKAALASALEVVGVDAEIKHLSFPDEDWKLAYRRHFKTEAIGKRLLVVPEWEADERGKSAATGEIEASWTDPREQDRREQERGKSAAPGAEQERVRLILDPGMAFGTGKHETTRACLEYIDDLADEGGTFLDIGCGSGILSIAAAKLGYSEAAGFDIDEDAVAASKENAALNGVQVDYRVFALGKGAVTLDESIEAAKGLYPDLALQGKANAAAGDADSGDAGCECVRRYDLVVANILGPLLIAFADEISGYVKSRLVISGILTEIYPEVLAAFLPRGFREVSRKDIGEWTTGLLVRV